MSENTISDAFAEWNRQVQLPGNISLADAGAILLTFGSTLDQADAEAWFTAVAVSWGDLGVINPGTYVGLRNFANNNEAGANNLFNGLLSNVNGLPESEPVNTAIRIQNLEDDQQVGIPGTKTTLEGFKTGDRLLDGSLDIGIDSLDQLDQQITDELVSLNPPPPPVIPGAGLARAEVVEAVVVTPDDVGSLAVVPDPAPPDNPLGDAPDPGGNNGGR